jgi:hypothetical protein
LCGDLSRCWTYSSQLVVLEGFEWLVPTVCQMYLFQRACRPAETQDVATTDTSDTDIFDVAAAFVTDAFSRCAVQQRCPVARDFRIDYRPFGLRGSSSGHADTPLTIRTHV